MPNDLKKIDNEIMKFSSNGEIKDVIDTMIKEIFLFDTRISKITSDENILKGIKIGNSLTLIREKNKYDNNDVAIYNKDNEKLGYIPEEDNIIFSRLMDAGKLLYAKIESIDFAHYYRVKIKIYLKDF